MKTDRKVVEYRREADGTYQRVELEPSRPCPCESSESKKIRSLAACGITVCRIKDRSRWAELRLVPAGTYTVVGEQITVPITYIVVTKDEAFLFDSHRYARELEIWQRESDDC